MLRETDRFRVVTHDGQQSEIVEFTTFVDNSSSGGLGEIAGPKQLWDSTGNRVHHVGHDEEYEIVTSLGPIRARRL
jgi:hypothetical protein